MCVCGGVVDKNTRLPSKFSMNFKHLDLQASLERVVENRLNSLTEDVGPMIR